MSFSSDVKNELSGKIPSAGHCRYAELLSFTDPVRAFSEEEVLKRDCCRRAFLRGLFLSCGTVTDPSKNYQLELLFSGREAAERVRELLLTYEIRAKILERKNHYVLYLKEGDRIADFLALIGASDSFFSMENVRVLKEVRNTVNRRVNCEAANLKKTANAAVMKMRDIEYISEHIGFDRLPESLRQIAVLRMRYPDISLTELGQMLDPPLGKSGVNHRLRRLSKIAEEEKL
ncbi:MAG: DNA-binding protein WhiA [Lachnospiraceae bacterium]|nr:DNA-binding protein WhiA [Lachnospiraceae bacterium]